MGDSQEKLREVLSNTIRSFLSVEILESAFWELANKYDIPIEEVIDVIIDQFNDWDK